MADRAVTIYMVIDVLRLSTEEMKNWILTAVKQGDVQKLFLCARTFNWISKLPKEEVRFMRSEKKEIYSTHGFRNKSTVLKYGLLILLRFMYPIQVKTLKDHKGLLLFYLKSKKELSIGGLHVPCYYTDVKCLTQLLLGSSEELKNKSKSPHYLKKVIDSIFLDIEEEAWK